MTDYISEADLRDYIGSDTTNFSATAQAVCTVVSRTIDAMCDRTFTTDTTATARSIPLEWRDDPYCHGVYDFWTTSGLVVKTDPAGDGSFSLTLTSSDYQLEPLNGIVGGLSGFPYTRIIAVGTAYFPLSVYRRPVLQVTAKWGWASVPDAVVHAARVGAASLFSMKDAPGGFVGLDGWGPVRVRENPQVRALLGPYMRNPVAVA